MLFFNLILAYLNIFLFIPIDAKTSNCQLPIQWIGQWYQNKYLDSSSINRTSFINKGACVESKQDKYLFYDSKEFCYRCIFVMQKHYNVLQFRASYCSDQSGFNYNCENLSPESELVTIYRENAISEKCPLNDLQTVAVKPSDMSDNPNCTNGQSSSFSTITQCADQTVLKLDFDKCATSLPAFTMNCIAHWSEGNTNYLIGRLPDGTNANSNYRCLIYTETSPDSNRYNVRRYYNGNDNDDTENFVDLQNPQQQLNSASNDKVQLTISQDEFCRNLVDSLIDDQNTFTFSKPPPLTRHSRLQNSTRKSRFPKWFNKRWNNMKSTRIFTLDYKLETILVLDEKNSIISSKHTCVQVKVKRANYYQAIVKTLNGCNSGFQCVTITSRSEFVTEIKFGKTGSTIQTADCGESSNNELLYVDTAIGVACPHNGNIFHKNYENLNEPTSSCKHIQSQILQIGCQNAQQYSLKTKLCYKKSDIIQSIASSSSPHTSITQLESEINLICLAYWHFNDYIVLMSKTMTNDVICSVWSSSSDDSTLKLYEIDSNCNYYKKSTFKLIYEFKKLYKCNEQQKLQNSLMTSNTGYLKKLNRYYQFFIFFIFIIN